jgi:hypothetical protein
MTDDELRAAITHVRGTITALRRTMLVVAAYEANPYTRIDPELKAGDAREAELCEQVLGFYDVLRLVAIKRDLRLPK